MACGQSDLLERSQYMKVLLVGRPQLALGGGGDKVALLKTQEYLRKIGVEAEVTYDIAPDYRGYDIAHLFTLSTWHAAKKAHQFGIPYVLSTIYWDSSDAEAWILKQKPCLIRLTRYLLAKNKSLRNFFNLFRNTARLTGGSLAKLPQAFRVSLAGYILHSDELKHRRQILEWASCLTPSSEIEMRHIEQKFGGTYPYVVVPHGVEPWFATATAEEFIRIYNIQDFVLCVSASMNYRKNQLSLIKALKGTGIPLVLIGGVFSRAEHNYFKKCKKEADTNVCFLPLMPREKLASAYKAARVFALPSLYDHPGLVYLEAAVAGCNVVATEIGSAREYLGDLAWYCNPYDVDSIRQAVLEAYHAPKTGKAQHHVLQNFTWERAAQLTLGVYQKVLEGCFGGTL